MLHQVLPYRNWPSGEGWIPLRLAAEPEDLRRALGIRFDTGTDALGAFEEAAVLLPGWGQCLLQRRPDAGYAGTDCVVDSLVSRSALQVGLESLGLDRWGFSWESPAELFWPFELRFRDGGSDRIALDDRYDLLRHSLPVAPSSGRGTRGQVRTVTHVWGQPKGAAAFCPYCSSAVNVPLSRPA